MRPPAFRERRHGAPLRVAVAVAVLALAARPAVSQDPEEAAPPKSDIETTLGLGPGAPPRSPALAASLRRSRAEKGGQYEVRSRHLTANGEPRYVNRLIREDSPYLLQHAHNPIDWHPWGPEALQLAASLERPIFLSIGYSTCHWCHVMEHESFDDLEVARLLNERFVAIKVDRERRPDVDEIYMTAVQISRGSGGWPLSALLTPQGEPFFAASYMPREPFLELLASAADAWRERRGDLETSAARLTEMVRLVTAAHSDSEAIAEGIVADAVSALLQRLDAEHGGFGEAPKFPHEPELLLLLRHCVRGCPEGTLKAIRHTLDRMARGGIYDQVGGGFHRYATDREWRLPHFEKMLYNQAQLGRVYLQAYQLTGDPVSRRVAEQTLDYVLREMTAPGGGFYSATDADSDGGEGRFFVWSLDELGQTLGPEDFALAAAVFGVTAEGELEGRNVLHVVAPWETLALRHEGSAERLFERIDGIRGALLRARQERPSPLRDDKIVTAWNGMMVTTLAQAHRALGGEVYLTAARRAADFVLGASRLGGDGSPGAAPLARVVLHGRASGEALQEDYAYLAEAMIELYDATGESRWLDEARRLTETMDERFWDPRSGGWFMTSSAAAGELIARPKSSRDGATAAGGAVAARVLALLAQRLEDPAYGQRFDAAVGAVGEPLSASPAGFAYTVLAIDERRQGGAGEVEYGAAGRVRARALWRQQGPRLEVELRIAPGWHVNADRPLDDDLVATELLLEGRDLPHSLQALTYPPAETVRLGFQDSPLAVYQGTVTIGAEVIAPGDADALSLPRLPLLLTIQACDASRCLQPETLHLEIFPRRGEDGP